MTRWRRGKGGGGGGGGYREGWWMSGGLDGLWVGARRPPPRQTSKKGAIERNRSASFTNVQTKRTDEEVEEEKSRQRVDPFASSPFDSSGQNKRKKGVFFSFFFEWKVCARVIFIRADASQRQRQQKSGCCSLLLLLLLCGGGRAREAGEGLREGLRVSGPSTECEIYVGRPASRGPIVQKRWHQSHPEFGPGRGS